MEALSRSHNGANFRKIQRVLYKDTQVIQLYKTFDVVIKSSLQKSVRIFYAAFAIIVISASKELPDWGETIGRNRHTFPSVPSPKR